MMTAISSTTTGAKPIDGSSIRRSLGCAIKALPIASICCSPPESVFANLRRRSSNLGNRSKIEARSELTVSWSFRRYAPVRRFSSTVRSGKTLRPSGTWAIPFATMTSGGRPSMRSSSSRISPVESFSSPEIARSVVVFPAPFAPIRVAIPPLLTESDMPRTAATLP